MENFEGTTPPGSPLLSPIPFTEYPTAEPAAPTMDEIAALFNEYPPSPEHEVITNFWTSHDEALDACKSVCESDGSRAYLNNLARDSKEAVDMLQSLIQEQRTRYMILVKQHVRRLRFVKEKESKIQKLSEIIDAGTNSQMRDQAAQVLELKRKLKTAENIISTLVSEGNEEQHTAREKQELADAEIMSLKEELFSTNNALSLTQKHNDEIMTTIRRQLDSNAVTTTINDYADYACDEWWKMRARLAEKEGVELELLAFRHSFAAENRKHQATIQQLERENSVLHTNADTAQWNLDMNETEHVTALAERDAELAALRSTVNDCMTASDEAHAGDWTWHPLKPRFDALAAQIEPLQERIKELEQREESMLNWEVYELQNAWKSTDPMVVARGKGYAEMVGTLHEERRERQEAEETWEAEKFELLGRVMGLESKVRELEGEGEVAPDGGHGLDWTIGDLVDEGENGTVDGGTAGWEI